MESLKWKFAVCGLAVLLVAICGIFFLLRREPRYQGVTLTEWLGEFGPPSSGQEGRVEAEKAICAMGASAVPQLVAYLRPNARSATLMDRLNEWTSERLGVAIPLAREKDRQYPALEALRILGPAAHPAIANIAVLLGDSTLGWRAADCLAVIGPAAIPALTNALASTNAQTRVLALIGLSELGESARVATPLIAARMHDQATSVGYQAEIALGEMGPAAEPYVPELERMIQQRDRGEGAAITLARLGHTVSLLRNLNNNEEEMRAWAAAALDPRLETARADQRRHPGNEHTENDAVFLLTSVKRSLADFYRGENPSRIIDLLQAHISDPDPAVRALVADDLGNYGLAAAYVLPALSNALSDNSEIVRRSVAAALGKIDAVVDEGGIIRGPRKEKKIALEFTAHTFAEGGPAILDALAKHHARASFFVTGDFLENITFRPLVERMVKEGHYLGPHSDKHLLYCSWEKRKQTLVSPELFNRDVGLNKLKAERFADGGIPIKFWLPAYEWYNQETVDWSRGLDLTLVNYTPGTRSNADYTEERDKNFVSSQVIYDSIVKHEREDPDGLNGFLLLMHLGAGPGRTDKMCDRLDELLAYLAGKGYQFVRIDELLGPK